MRRNKNVSGPTGMCSSCLQAYGMLIKPELGLVIAPHESFNELLTIRAEELCPGSFKPEFSCAFVGSSIEVALSAYAM